MGWDADLPHLPLQLVKQWGWGVGGGHLCPTCPQAEPCGAEEHGPRVTVAPTPRHTHGDPRARLQTTFMLSTFMLSIYVVLAAINVMTALL